MVLRSLPPPAWMASDAPEQDVAISSRVRYARNLAGTCFPERLTDKELERIADALTETGKRHGMTALSRLSIAEREYLVGCRLVSADFAFDKPGRRVLHDERRLICAMIHEEDHLRLQAVTPGWSIESAHQAADAALANFSCEHEFARHPDIGWLTASPINAGQGRRRSALFHLIGLAQTGELPKVLPALREWRVEARGIFGESSRAVGGFFQISMIQGRPEEFRGAGEYLMKEERRARSEMARSDLADRAQQARDFAESARTLGLADALRILAWVRWARGEGLAGWPGDLREVDLWVSAMEVHGAITEEAAAKRRADYVRARLNAEPRNADAG